MKLTRKDILNKFNKVYSIGYCDLQFLLRGQNRIGYNSGIYGWNYDVFSLDNGNIAICTGYRGTTGVRIDSDIIRKYEEKARVICNDYNLKYEDMQKKLDKLIKKFIEELNK